MKAGNRRLLLNIIRRAPVSRAELARITGLTRAAVTLIVDELIKEAVLVEVGTAESEMGRKPVLLDLNPQSHYVVGISIARVACYIGILNIKAECIAKQEVDFEPSVTAEECMQIIIRKIKKMMADIAIPKEQFTGIGIMTPGPVDIFAGEILNPPNFERWHHVNIVNQFKKSFQFPVYLENYSAALALAEKNYGRGIEFSSFILMVVNEGVGAGIIIKDNLYRGAGGFGSEAGHTTVDLNGKLCSCGNKGCLEVYTAIPNVLKSISLRRTNIKSWEEIVDRADARDEVCRNIVLQEGRYLAAGITSIMNVLELEAVILTGQINYRPELLLEAIRSNIESMAITRQIRRFPVMISSITENIQIKAAAAVAIEKFFRGSDY